MCPAICSKVQADTYRQVWLPYPYFKYQMEADSIEKNPSGWFNDPQKRRCMKLTAGGCFIVVFLLILTFLITYAVKFGAGNETHTTATMGTCRTNDANDSPYILQIMTFNAFLIDCIPGAKCQESTQRAERVKEIGKYFASRDEDVVLFQEVWTYHEELRDGMTNAGFCHYVMSERSNGSGLAIFSKHPIIEEDFVDWFDAFGIGE